MLVITRLIKLIMKTMHGILTKSSVARYMYFEFSRSLLSFGVSESEPSLSHFRRSLGVSQGAPSQALRRMHISVSWYKWANSNNMIAVAGSTTMCPLTLTSGVSSECLPLQDYGSVSWLLSAACRLSWGRNTQHLRTHPIPLPSDIDNYSVTPTRGGEFPHEGRFPGTNLQKI